MSTQAFLAYILYRKTQAHLRLHDFENTISSARDSSQWFGVSDDGSIPALVAETLLLQATAEARQGNYGSSISVLDKIIQRLRSYDSIEARRTIVKALVQKARCLQMYFHRNKEAMEIFEDAIQRASNMDISRINNAVFDAFMGLAFARSHLGDYIGEIASYDKLIATFFESNLNNAEFNVALASSFKFRRQAEIGLIEESIAGCLYLEKTLSSLAEVRRPWISWQLLATRTIAQMRSQEVDDAFSTFREACVLGSRESEVWLRNILRLVLNLIVAGASERDVFEVLVSDNDLAEYLYPLVVALGKRVGEDVRAPKEVMHVATDIYELLTDRAAKGVLTAF